RLFIMTSRFAFVGFMVQLFTFTTLFATDSLSQYKDVREVIIAVNVSQATLESALEAIEAKTPYKFSYEEKDLAKRKGISLPQGNRTVEELLLGISKSARVHFKQVNHNIHVKPLKERGVEHVVVVEAVQISGRVVSGTDGVGIPGVNILIKGSSIGTVSDIDGKFSIDVPRGDETLVFSSIGYVSQEVSINGRELIMVTLEEDLGSLEEIVVVGYGQQRKVNLTGAIAAVKTDDIVDIPLGNLSNGLAGRAPGVQVVGTSGLAGASSSIRIRGGSVEPLFVINGVIKGKADFDALNPNEVESINFLKDAASASIYGSSAGNGVVLVTTKGGSNQKPELQYKGTYSSSSPTRPVQNFTAQEEIR